MNKHPRADMHACKAVYFHVIDNRPAAAAHARALLSFTAKPEVSDE